MAFDREKFKRLVHYVAWKGGQQAGFGAAKLSKVLWYADARSYLLTGKPMTGATYIREKYGPVPRQLPIARRELEQEGKLAVIEPDGADAQSRFRALAPPDAAFLSPSEQQEIDYGIKHVGEKQLGDSDSDRGHDYPWEIARLGEEIPLYASLADRIRASSGKELDWARTVAEKRRLP